MFSKLFFSKLILFSISEVDMSKASSRKLLGNVLAESLIGKSLKLARVASVLKDNVPETASDILSQALEAYKSKRV